MKVRIHWPGKMAAIAIMAALIEPTTKNFLWLAVAGICMFLYWEKRIDR